MPKAQYLTAPVKSDRMPPGVPFIVSSEAAERFSYYGMNSILVVFMTTQLRSAAGQPAPMASAEAEGWYHAFVTAVYFLPLLGAILADAFVGKFRTIMALSIVYCLGHLALALDHTRMGLVLGLSLIALGAGGIKPCVSATVGDQFGKTNQHLLSRVFNWFYFSINVGSAFSTMLIPWLLEPYKVPAEAAAQMPAWQVHFWERIHSPDVAFGVPGLLMIVATVVFWVGRYRFVHIPPAGRKYLDEFWVPGVGVNMETLRTLGNLLIPVPFVAMFWALWQQNFSSWVLQSEKMDRHLFGKEWLPAQIQTVNPIFILLALPIFSYVIYPLIEKVFRLTPLRKIGMGLFVTIFAFLIIAWIQLRIDAGGKPNIIWQVFAFAVLTAGEVLVSATHLEFAYSQAPNRLKSLVMCTYLIAISLGNAFTAAVNFLMGWWGMKAETTGYFVFFIVTMSVFAVVFVFVARSYRGRTHVQDETA